MRQHFRKLLSALVALTLVLLVIPSLTGHTASALTLIDSGRITGIDAPVAGATPDYTASIQYSPTMMKFQDLNSSYYKNGIGWKDDTAGSVIKTTDTFIEGHQYTVIISLDAKSGYCFSVDGSTVHSKGYINGNTATGKYLTDTRIEFRYTFPKAQKLRVGTVTITGITAPKVGHYPSYSSSVSASGCSRETGSGTWYHNGVAWNDLTLNKMMTPGDKFVAGHTYRVIVSMIADSTYTFCDSEKNVVATGTINGNAAGTTRWNDTNVGFTYDFVPEGVVSKVTITDIDTPRIGNKPDYTKTWNPNSQVVGDTYSNDNTWYKGTIWFDETTGQAIKPSDTFLEGHQYRVRVSMYTREGYSFCDVNGNVATKATINGYEATPYKYSTKNVGFDYTFPKLDKIVKSVAITGLDAPAIGKNPDYTATVSGDGGVKVEDYTNGSSFFHGIRWWNKTDSQYLTPSSTFEAGKVYVVTFSIEASAGYGFSDSTGVVTTATLNGVSVPGELYEWEGDTLGLDYEFPELKALVSSVTITGVDAPVAGKTPDYNITAKGSGFVNDTYASSYWKNGICWIDVTEDNSALAIDDTFEAGHAYKVRVSLYAKDGYTFKNAAGEVATKATFDGKASTGSHQFDEPENIGFEYEFPPLAQVVTGAAITIDAPTAGAKPDYTASGSGAGFDVESDYSSENIWLNGVEWYDMTANKWVHADTDTFTAGHQYKVIVSLMAKDGYFFDDTSTGAINGKAAEIYEIWSPSNAGFSYTFDKLPEAATIISGVTITDVTAPVAGEQPSYSATVTGEGFAVEDYSNGSNWVHGVIWMDMTTGDNITPESVFVEGHVYRIGFSLEPKAGYTFKDNSGNVVTPGTINGQPVSETYAYFDGTVAYRYVFPETPASGSGHLFPVDFYGFMEYSGGLFYVYQGDVVTDANGLVNDPNNPADWYFCSSGQAQLQYSGLAEYGGEWFYLENGKLNTTRTGIVEYDGGRFMIAAGRILREVNGLIQDPNTGLWYYVAAGQVADYTGLVLYDGAWFYVVNGELATGYTGPVVYDGSTFNVVNGQVA